MRSANIHEVGEVILVCGLGRQGKGGVGGEYTVDAVFSLWGESSGVPSEDGTRAFARLGVGHLSRWLVESQVGNRHDRKREIGEWE